MISSLVHARIHMISMYIRIKQYGAHKLQHTRHELVDYLYIQLIQEVIDRKENAKRVTRMDWSWCAKIDNLFLIESCLLYIFRVYIYVSINMKIKVVR